MVADQPLMKKSKICRWLSLFVNLSTPDEQQEPTKMAIGVCGSDNFQPFVSQKLLDGDEDSFLTCCKPYLLSLAVHFGAAFGSWSSLALGVPNLHVSPFFGPISQRLKSHGYPVTPTKRQQMGKSLRWKVVSWMTSGRSSRTCCVFSAQWMRICVRVMPTRTSQETIGQRCVMRGFQIQSGIGAWCNCNWKKGWLEVFHNTKAEILLEEWRRFCIFLYGLHISQYLFR